ncbi:MAG: hypothetical protein NTZ69_15800 [Bacteroidia bacterium]|nr:hypothetical protein [Bacteroidia bacterium]
MTNKDTIEKVNRELRYGDKTVISQQTGLSRYSVVRFFNGKEHEMIEDSQSRIMEAALEIISQRKKRKSRIEKKTNSIID